eukprot:UN04849
MQGKQLSAMMSTQMVNAMKHFKLGLTSSEIDPNKPIVQPQTSNTNNKNKNTTTTTSNNNNNNNDSNLNNTSSSSQFNEEQVKKILTLVKALEEQEQRQQHEQTLFRGVMNNILSSFGCVHVAPIHQDDVQINDKPKTD